MCNELNIQKLADEMQISSRKIRNKIDEGILTRAKYGHILNDDKAKEFIKNNSSSNKFLIDSKDLNIQKLADKMQIDSKRIREKIKEGLLTRSKRGYILNDDKAIFFIKTNSKNTQETQKILPQEVVKTPPKIVKETKKTPPQKEKTNKRQSKNKKKNNTFDISDIDPSDQEIKEVQEIDWDNISQDKVAEIFNISKTKITLATQHKKEIELKEIRSKLVDKDLFMNVLEEMTLLLSKALGPELSSQIRNTINLFISDDQKAFVLENEIIKVVNMALDNYKNSVLNMYKLNSRDKEK